MHITVTVKQVYGSPVVYPVDRTARLFADIAGTKTLTLPVLQRIKILGFDIRQTHQPADALEELLK